MKLDNMPSFLAAFCNLWMNPSRNPRLRLNLLSMIAICIFFLVAALPVDTAKAGDEDWEPVGEGIEYQRFRLPAPNNVFVARMDRNNPNTIIESSIGLGKLSGSQETVRSQAARYDQALNFWGPPENIPLQSWGSRNKVVVAINGSGFPFDTGIPDGGQIHSGWYAKRFDETGGTSGFTWKMDRSVFMGECVFHRQEKQVINFIESGMSMFFDGINVRRRADELILYTPQFDVNTATGENGVEVLVEVERPTMVFPLPRWVVGVVREIRDQKGSMPIPFDHVVLSANGLARETLLANIQIGDQIGISNEITNCASGGPSWTKAYASVGAMSIGGASIFLRDGVIQPSSNTDRHPRTAVAFNDEFIFFIVVDGRDPDNSIGMTVAELAAFTRDVLGAIWGVHQDGGGSSTMVVNGVVKNNTHCNNVICKPIEEPGEHKIYVPLSVQSNPVTFGVQRQVANGLMMVVVEPMVQSDSFTPTQTVTTTVQSQIRLGPGTNYGVVGSVPSNTPGAILSPLNNLNGVLAKGSYWWKVSLGGIAGWVPEENLIANTERIREAPRAYRPRWVGESILVEGAQAGRVGE